MISVGACAEEYLSAKSSSVILKKISSWMGLSKENAIQGIAYAFSLHDIGKAHPFFQYRQEGIYEALRRLGYVDTRDKGDNSFRHEIYGADVIGKIWREEKDRFPGDGREIMTAVIRLHHQGKAPDKSNTKPARMWLEIQRDLECRMRNVFSPNPVFLPKIENADALGITLAALLILCDWVASSSTFGVCESAEDPVCHEWARTRAKEVLSEFGLISDVEIAFPYERAFCDFWRAIPENGMRPLQRVCEEIGAHSAELTIIEAPPGEGKTEAALYLAGRLCEQKGIHGIYMALPTAATSNQMVSRVSTVLNEHGIDRARLLHGSAWMVDEVSQLPEGMALEEDAVHAADWLRPLRRGMLSENAVGTVDQAMASVLRIKYGMLRLLGLAEKVLIIDEIHAYDAYMSRIIARLLDWCRALQIPVILLSATLQQTQKEKYIACYSENRDRAVPTAYPLITCVDQSGNIHFHPVDGTYVHTQFQFKACRGLGDITAMVDMAQKKVELGGCLCVMLNTVARAQAVYSELKRRGEKHIMLFLARFRMGRRMEIEQECLKVFGTGKYRPERMILVCTQVVEQSLDVDFDGMITELAPVDLLIQRAGRVHRHAGVYRPNGLEARKVVVFVPRDDATDDLEKRYLPFGSIYAPCVLRSTEKWLGEEKTVRIPEDVRDCIEQVYQNLDDDLEAFVRKIAEDASAEVAADGCMYAMPDEKRFFGRIPSAIQSINMEDSEEANELLRRGGAKTRNGLDSVCIAFLPRDYQSPAGNEREKAKDIMRYSISVSSRVLTKSTEGEIMKEIRGIIKSVSIENNFLNGVIPIKEEGDNRYSLLGHRFTVDDDIGMREEE